MRSGQGPNTANTGGGGGKNVILVVERKGAQVAGKSLSIEPPGGGNGFNCVVERGEMKRMMNAQFGEM